MGTTTATALRDKLLPPDKKKGDALPYDTALHPAVAHLLGTSDPKGLWDETLALLQTLIRNKVSTIMIQPIESEAFLSCP